MDARRSNIVERSPELKRQLAEIRRLAVLHERFGPAIDGVSWIRSQLETCTREPILCVLEFKFKPEFDLIDASKGARKLWNNAIEYIWSIPGCISIQWGPVLGDRSTVICLIQWDNGEGWLRFQNSLGFSPIRGMLEGIVYNRCSKLKLSPCANETSTIDLVSVTVDGDAQPEYRESLEQEWSAVIAPYHGNMLLSANAGWLEHNALILAEPPTPDEVAAARKSTVFVGFLQWHANNDGDHPGANVCEQLQAVSPLGITRTVSRKVVNLINEVRKPDAVSERPQPNAPMNSLPDIFATEIRRQFNRHSDYKERVYRDVQNSRTEAMEGRRLFPKVNGVCGSQGQLFDKCKLAIPKLHEYPNPQRRYFIFDIAWLQLKSPLPKRAPQLFGELNDQMRPLAGYKKGLWARVVEKPSQIAVVTGE